MSQTSINENDNSTEKEEYESEYTVQAEKISLSSYVTLLGKGTLNCIFKIFNLISSPVIRVSHLIRFTFSYFFNFIKKSSRSFRNETGSFINDIKVALLLLKENNKATKHQRQKSIKLIYHFYKNAITKHKSFLIKSLNYVFPLVSVIILCIVISMFADLNFALGVTYNNTHIGYIENENVFLQAKDILEQRLEIGGVDSEAPAISQPEYKISIVNLSELSDSNDICEQLIELSDSTLTTACGIYVDNKFIGSVKNESDASSVFKSYISAYCRSNSIDESNPQVILELVENVSYVQGLYDKDTLMDSDDLREYLLTNNKSEIRKYTAKSGDTAESICMSNNLTVEQFFAINPNLDKDKRIKKDTVVNVMRNIPFVNVMVSKTKTTKKQIKFDTVEIKTDALYKGVQKVITPGVNGEKEVVTLISYIDGVEVSSKEISSRIIKESTNQKVYTGTKPVPNNVTILGSQSGAFIWPVVGANTITSSFGYRYIFGGTSFHKGIDIAGPGANGKPIVASASGTVERVVNSNSGYGCNLIIDHGNGIKTRYAHCMSGSICVKPGQNVVQGQMIARLGNTGNSTGSHLHFEIIYNGSFTNPINYLTR